MLFRLPNESDPGLHQHYSFDVGVIVVYGMYRVALQWYFLWRNVTQNEHTSWHRSGFGLGSYEQKKPLSKL